MSSAESELKRAGITNVFVLMLENHSFDHIFAMSGIPGITAATSANINNYNGQTYSVVGGAPASMSTDPGHEFADVAQQLFAENGGFAINYATSLSEDTGVPGKERIGDIMACFHTKTQLPVIYQLACEYALCDHWFSSLPGPTWPNRFFVHGGSSAGLDRSPRTMEEIEWEVLHGFAYEKGSIYQSLTQAGHKWRLYSDFYNRYREPGEFKHGGWIPQVAALKGINILDVNPLDTSHDSPTWADQFAADLQKDYPYAYTFIEPNFGRSFFDKQAPFSGPSYKAGSSQHPEDDCYGGECLIKAVYEAIRNSPLWESSLLVIVYDEHGGFYDHVPPPAAVPPGDSNVNKLTGLNGFDFGRYGVRVPAVIVSPLIAKGTVDKTIYDHTSILATLQSLFGMPSLTQRDHCANDLCHLFEKQILRDDADCPRVLNMPFPPIVQNQISTIADNDRALPDTGNWLGFLQILLKIELELSSNDPDVRAEIIDAFKKILTTAAAKDYTQKMFEKILGIRIKSS